MRAIVHKNLKRKAEDPSRPSAFRLRGKPVPEHKIERYEKDKGLCNDHFDPLEATPSAISCDTPRSMPKSPTIQLEASTDGLSTSNHRGDMNSKSSGPYFIDSESDFSGDPLCAYVTSAIINSYEDFVKYNLSGSTYGLAAAIKEIILHLDIALGEPLLEVNVSNDPSASSLTDFYAYNLGDLWSLMHSYVIPNSQYPVPGYSTPAVRLQWEFPNQPVTEGIIKLELPDKLLDLTGDITADLQGVDSTEPRAQVKAQSESQSCGHQDCRCSFCCLTLTDDIPAEPDMESFKELSLGPRGWFTDHYTSSQMDQNCSLCCLALASDALAALDPESLTSRSGGTLSSTQLFTGQVFKLVWSSGRESGEAITNAANN